MLDNGIRDPRAYVDIKKIAKFRNDIKVFAVNAEGLSDDLFKSFVKRNESCKIRKYYYKCCIKQFSSCLCIA